MTINVGDAIPDVVVRTMRADGPDAVSLPDLCAGKKVVLFAVPGAYTPTCNAKHLPGFVEHAAQFRDKGVDLIACISVNDVFVMDAWGKHADVGESIMMLSDGNGEFAAASGLEMDGSAFGMGKRLQRFAMVVEDGKVTSLQVEQPGAFEVSSAEAVLPQV